MKSEIVDPASFPDDENPEWTERTFETALPALEVISSVFGADAAEELRRGRGRPLKADKKVSQNLRLDPDVLDAYKREGSGWQTRINQVLRDNMPKRKKSA